jgi:hypothetical protein
MTLPDYDYARKDLRNLPVDYLFKTFLFCGKPGKKRKQLWIQPSTRGEKKHQRLSRTARFGRIVPIRGKKLRHVPAAQFHCRHWSVSKASTTTSNPVILSEAPRPSSGKESEARSRRIPRLSRLSMVRQGILASAATRCGKLKGYCLEENSLNQHGFGKHSRDVSTPRLSSIVAIRLSQALRST